MGYYSAKHWRNPNKWRVFWRKYEKGNPKPQRRHIKESEYAQLGIRKDMTREEVDAVLKKLSAEETLKQREARRQTIQARLDEEANIECAHLPEPFVTKFKTEHLATRYMGNEARLTKVLKLWRASERLIRKVKLPTEKWHRYPEHFYDQMVKACMSPGYAKNILSTINMWLDFLGLEQDKLYRPIPAPNNVWQARINTAFEEADKSQASLPITPEQLTAAKPMPNQAQFNWVYSTVWAGLRPNESSSLLNPKRTKISYQDGVPILEIYQSKLKNVPKASDRWKYIPLFLPEQQRILEFISSKCIEEPLAKTMSDRFGPGCTLYAGRKGFHDLMVTRYGQPELEVVRWLGHRSLDMAMKHYAKKTAVRWEKLKAS